MSDRPGSDSALKLRLAALSAEAARVLGPGTLRPCADVRVRQAVAAALADPALTDRARREVAGLAADLATDEPEARALTLRFRASDAEAEAIRARAEAAGLTLSDYVRRAALGG